MAKKKAEKQPEEKSVEIVLRSQVNDWNFDPHLEHFRRHYLLPMEKRVAEAEKVMENPKQRWNGKEQKEEAARRLAEMDGMLAFYRILYGTGKELILQHESLTDLVVKVYQTWFQNISMDGEQLTQMMDIQAKMWGELMQELFEAIEPLKLENVKPTKYQKDENITD